MEATGVARCPRKCFVDTRRGAPDVACASM